MGRKSGISSFLAKDKRATGSNSKHRPDCHCKGRSCWTIRLTQSLRVCIPKVYILCNFKTDISVAHKKNALLKFKYLLKIFCATQDNSDVRCTHYAVWKPPKHFCILMNITVTFLWPWFQTSELLPTSVLQFK